MSLRGIRFCFIATSSVSAISYLVDSQPSQHWTSETGHHPLKSLPKVVHSFKSKDIYLIGGKHDFVRCAAKT